MANEILREIPTVSNAAEARLNLDENGNILAFLEQVFNLFAEEDMRGNSIKLTAPSWWGLARLMRISDDTMNDAYSELK